MDYYLDPEVWFQANLRLTRSFRGHPVSVVVDGVRMAIEPSLTAAGFTSRRISRPPSRRFDRIEDAESLPEINRIPTA